MSRSTTTQLAKDLRQLRNGEKKPFHDFYESHFNTLYFYIVSVVRSHQDAEEAVQELFISIFKKGDLFSGSERPVEYLYRCARNAALKQFRSRSKEGAKTSLDAALFVADDHAGNEVRDLQELELVNEALQSLPDEQREVMVLKVFQELTFEEIASTIQAPLQTVASRYRYAVQKLKERWHND